MYVKKSRFSVIIYSFINKNLLEIFYNIYSFIYKTL